MLSLHLTELQTNKSYFVTDHLIKKHIVCINISLQHIEKSERDEYEKGSSVTAETRGGWRDAVETEMRDV